MDTIITIIMVVCLFVFLLNIPKASTELHEYFNSLKWSKRRKLLNYTFIMLLMYLTLLMVAIVTLFMIFA